MHCIYPKCGIFHGCIYPKSGIFWRRGRDCLRTIVRPFLFRYRSPERARNFVGAAASRPGSFVKFASLLHIREIKNAQPRAGHCCIWVCGEGGCRTCPPKLLSVAGFRRSDYYRSPIGPRWEKVFLHFLINITNACFTKNCHENTKFCGLAESLPLDFSGLDEHSHLGPATSITSTALGYHHEIPGPETISKPSRSLSRHLQPTADFDR